MTNVKKEGGLVNNINGNIVHVTVNNFIASDKKNETAKNSVNSRPYSSDQKDREKEKRSINNMNQKKIIPYEPVILSNSSKNPYEQRLGAPTQTRAGSSGKAFRPKK